MLTTKVVLFKSTAKRTQITYSKLKPTLRLKKKSMLMRRAEDAEVMDSVSMRDQPETDAETAANAMVIDTAQDTDGAMVGLDQETGNQRRRLSEKERKSVSESTNRSACQNTLKQ
jgi:hypothetical protein